MGRYPKVDLAKPNEKSRACNRSTFCFYFTLSSGDSLESKTMFSSISLLNFDRPHGQMSEMKNSFIPSQMEIISPCGGENDFHRK